MNRLPLLSLSARLDLQRPAGESMQQGVEAWRMALEQEQQAALRRFRSVPAPDPSAAPAGTRTSLPGAAAAASGPVPISAALRHPGAPQATAGKAGSYAASAPASAASQLSAKPASPLASQQYSQPDLRPHSQPQPASGAAAATTAAVQAATTGPAMTAPVQASIGRDLSAAASAFATSLAWTSRNLHFMRVDDGMQVWLRDSTLAADGAAVAQCIAELRQVLAGLDLRLAGFTLNGLPVPLT